MGALRRAGRMRASALAFALALAAPGCGDGDMLADGGASTGAGGHGATASDSPGGSRAPGDGDDDDDDDGDGEDDPSDEGGSGGGSGHDHEPIVGVAFKALTVRTEDGQTVALQGITGVAAMPDGSGLVAWEKSGRITHYRVEDDGLVLLGEMRLDGVYATDDCGLVTLAFDPDWASNHYFFVAHCTDLKYAGVLRYEFDGEHYDTVAESMSPVMEIGDATAKEAWHNIGSIGFFDDERHSMWVLAGEKFVSDNAQDLSVDLGKVLRIVPRRERELAGYEPHPDNPFAGDPDRSSGPDIYAWGVRSPWRGTIDGEGRIYLGDVGERTEEINVVREAGQNFGWATVDGPCEEHEDCGDFTDPTAYWRRSSDHRYRVEDKNATPSTARVAWVGAYYEGAEHDRYDGFLDDTVLFSDMCVGFVRALSIDERGKATRDEQVGHLSGLSGATVGVDGYLYVTSFGGCTSSTRGVGGGIYRVLPRAAEDPLKVPVSSGDPLVEDPLGPMPPRLSETGLFAGDKLERPSKRGVRYEPTLPLWSNGTDKERFVVLPEGGKIDNRDRAAWDFPPGTLFVKTFSLVDVNGVNKRIETRIIRRTQSGYEFHGYKWNAAGSNADLLSLELSVPVKTQVGEASYIDHTIPSAFDCRTCHESNRTVIIGFDELRLNGPRSGEEGSQLDALAAAGLFDEELPANPAHLSAPDELTTEVLGYLHGNCAHCHNGSPNTHSALSLEHDVALANTIGVETQASGQVSGVRVVPGSPQNSVLFQAFWREKNAKEVEDMPPLGVQEIDAEAAEMIREWIGSLEP